MKECKAPGGGADPNRDAVWDDYRKRKAEAQASDPDAKGKAKGVKGG